MKVLMAIRKRPWLQVLLGSGLLVMVAGLVLFKAAYTEPIDSYTKCADAGYPIETSDPPVCRAGRHYFTGPRAAATPDPAAGASAAAFELLVDGDSHGTYPRQEEVIRDQASWQRYWARIHAATGTVPPLIPINFATSDVIAISQGSQPTAGYSYRVTGITTGPAGTAVNITEVTPTITCHVAQMQSNRYFIVGTTKLPEPVIFRTTRDYRRC
jgi:hypothetical protein